MRRGESAKLRRRAFLTIRARKRRDVLDPDRQLPHIRRQLLRLRFDHALDRLRRANESGDDATAPISDWLEFARAFKAKRRHAGGALNIGGPQRP